jgi:hypothetical protein
MVVPRVADAMAGVMVGRFWSFRHGKGTRRIGKKKRVVKGAKGEGRGESGGRTVFLDRGGMPPLWLQPPDHRAARDYRSVGLRPGVSTPASPAELSVHGSNRKISIENRFLVQLDAIYSLIQRRPAVCRKNAFDET